MVHPLLVSIVGRGVWIAVGAGLGYLFASKQDKTSAEAGKMSEVVAGHMAFIVEDYEVKKVLQPGAFISDEELPGIINVKYAGHLPQGVALEVQHLLAKGKIKLGIIESMAIEHIPTGLTEALQAKNLQKAKELVEQYHKLFAEKIDQQGSVGSICFWVWLIDKAKSFHYNQEELQKIGIVS
ncbi:MAG: hypothetical protein RBS57_03460 [Desulforhabdus sp.]|jgi:hypothetical protein|nr:hypothetical protein [Desulforhabdus sp.]